MLLKIIPFKLAQRIIGFLVSIGPRRRDSKTPGKVSSREVDVKQSR
jgi:hypothetical protein